MKPLSAAFGFSVDEDFDPHGLKLLFGAAADSDEEEPSDDDDDPQGLYFGAGCPLPDDADDDCGGGEDEGPPHGGEGDDDDEGPPHGGEDDADEAEVDCGSSPFSLDVPAS